MLFAVTMEVALPADLDPDRRADLLAREKAYSQDLQHGGEWVSIWRIVGQYANLSIFDVTDTTRLHDILWGLPLFPYMAVQITALTAHPSAIETD